VAEANRRRGSGTREQVNSRRINLEFNTCVHGSNARNLPVYQFLSQLAKMLCPSYYCLYSLSTKLKIRAEQFLPESKGWGEMEVAVVKGRRWRVRGKMTQTLYVHMNK
jgi:hypothetical protein